MSHHTQVKLGEDVLWLMASGISGCDVSPLLSRPGHEDWMSWWTEEMAERARWSTDPHLTVTRKPRAVGVGGGRLESAWISDAHPSLATML